MANAVFGLDLQKVVLSVDRWESIGLPLMILSVHPENLRHGTG
jgi:hypothetical protein